MKRYILNLNGVEIEVSETQLDLFRKAWKGKGDSVMYAQVEELPELTPEEVAKKIEEIIFTEKGNSCEFHVAGVKFPCLLYAIGPFNGLTQVPLEIQLRTTGAPTRITP